MGAGLEELTHAEINGHDLVLSGYAAVEEVNGPLGAAITGNASFRHEAGSTCGMGGALPDGFSNGKVLESRASGRRADHPPKTAAMSVSSMMR
jgi:hypothetical protein